jgi:MFS family permease
MAGVAKFRNPWTAVASAFLLNGALFGIWASRIPAFVGRFGLDEGALGLLLVCAAVGAILSFPVFGILSDRVGAAVLTRALGAMSAVVLVALSLSPSVAFLAVILTLFGAAQGGMDISMNAWAAEVERALRRPVMSTFHAFFSLGAGLGAGTGYLAASSGVAVFGHFLLAGVALFALFAVLSSIPWTSVRISGRSPFAIPRGALAVVGVVALCSSLGEGAIADWSAVFLHEVKGLSEGQAALGYAVYSIAMVAVRLSGDYVIRRFGAVLATRLSGIVAAAGMLVVLGSESLPLELAGFVLLGSGYAFVFPLAFSRAANDPNVPSGRGIASVATVAYGGILVGPPTIGFIAAAWTLPIAFGIIAVLALLMSALAGSLRPVMSMPLPATK